MKNITKKIAEKAIRKVLGSDLAFKTVSLEEDCCEGDNVYFDFGYQVDDRSYDSDKDFKDALEKELGIFDNDNAGVSVDRRDAFPSGHAYYVTTIEVLADEA